MISLLTPPDFYSSESKPEESTIISGQHGTFLLVDFQAQFASQEARDALLDSFSGSFAFVQDDQGTIWVRVQKEQEDRVMMEVADNGVGFPADLDFRRTGSLGLQVVVSLVQNLGGEIELKRENGTALRIVFPPIRN